MGLVATKILKRETFAAPGDGTTSRFVVPAGERSQVSRIGVWILATDEPITVTFNVAFDGDEFPIQNKIGATVPKDEWSPDTDEDLPLGDLVVELISGTPAPAKIVAVAVGLSKT